MMGRVWQGDHDIDAADAALMEVYNQELKAWEHLRDRRLQVQKKGNICTFAGVV